MLESILVLHEHEAFSLGVVVLFVFIFAHKGDVVYYNWLTIFYSEVGKKWSVRRDHPPAGGGNESGHK